MKNMLLNIFLFCALFVNAQNTKQPREVPEEFRKIKLQKYPNYNFPESNIPVSGIQVVQFVGDSVRLGYAMQGLNRHIVSLTPEKPLTAFLQEHIQKMFKKDFKKEGVKILWVINQLRLGEKAATTQFSYNLIDADSYMSRDGSLFKKVCNIDTVFVADMDLSIPISYGAVLERALKETLVKTMRYAGEALEQRGDEMTIEQIARASKLHLNLPILTNDSYRNGAYKNFEEFLQNKPSIIDYELTETEDKNVRFISAGGENQKTTLEVWGVCRNGKISKYHNQTLIPIKKQGNAFIVSDYVEKVSKRNSKLFTNMMIGSAIGGPVGIALNIAAMNAAEKIMSVDAISYIEDATKRPDATCIHMKTGEFSF